MARHNRALFSLAAAIAGALIATLTFTCQHRRAGQSEALATTAPSTLSSGPFAGSNPDQAAPDPALTLSPNSRTEDEQNTIRVFQKAAKACVFVTQQQMVMDYFGGPAHEEPAGSGSGFLWDVDGHVVTNYHVVAQAERLTVTLHDQQTYVAKVVGVEPRKDIAVLKIDAPKEALVPIDRHLGALELQVGRKVVAIGNPFGLDQTLTTGIVSALGRQVEGIGGVKIRDMIQTDAAINPGNSGGPLLDSTGRLIGMNTMIFSRSGSSAGIGFAVSAQTIARVVPQLIKSGRVEQVGLGVEIDPEQRFERRLGLRGLVIIGVVPGSNAEKAGLKGLERTIRGIRLGDVIVAIDGKDIVTYDDLYSTLDGRRPGETVKVKLIRERKALEVTLTLVALQ